MTSRTIVLPLGLGFSALLCSAASAASDETPRPPVRVYTNADLERVHPFRHETGVDSVPAEAPPSSPAEGGPASRAATRRGRGEAYWRGEAARVRRRVETLAASATEIEAKLADQRELARALSGRTRPGAEPGRTATAGLQLKLESLRRRIRAAEDDLAERARRDGALPGWLR